LNDKGRIYGGLCPPFLLILGMEKVHLISLGCPKNQVDSEVILGLLLRDGLIPVFMVEEAGVVIVNTPHSAYVKIAEGCSHPCTFCLIPQLRGEGAQGAFGICP